MPATTDRITLLGATGYTGKLIAQALARAGMSFRIAGRSAEKLARLSEDLPNQPDWITVDITQPNSLPPLFKNTRLLINCAGPFTDLGERVIAQAALYGVNYLDITNELGYVFRARGYHELALKNGAALVPACGFEVALADCAAHLAGSALVDPRQADSPPLDEFNILYSLDGKSASRGTRLSAIRSLGTSWIAYRDGDWKGQIPGGQIRQFTLPVCSDGRAAATNRSAYSFPSSESVTLPAHLPVRRVDAWMAASPGARFWGPVFIPLLARMSRSILRGLILNLASLGGFSPDRSPETSFRSDSPFSIYIEARLGAKKSTALLTGLDPYALTAEIITYAARQLTSPDYSQRGWLAPAQAFDPRDLLNYAKAHWGLSLFETSA